MQAIEFVGRVFAGYLQNWKSTAVVHINESAHIIDDSIDNDPQVPFNRMTANFFASIHLESCHLMKGMKIKGNLGETKKKVDWGTSNRRRSNCLADSSRQFDDLILTRSLEDRYH